MDNRVLVLLSVTEAEQQQFLNAFPEGNFVFRQLSEVTAEDVQQAEVVLGNVPPALTKDAVSLRWLQTESAGVDGYLAAGLIGRGVTVTNATGAYGQAVAEHMFAMLLALQKHLPIYRDQQQTACWTDPGLMAQSIQESTVLTVGLGDIGGTFSRLCRAVGAKTIGVRRSAPAVSLDAEEVYRFDMLDTLLPQADAVALALPSTPETIGMFSRERLSRCKPGALILNVGRGNVLDQEALCDLIECGHIGGVGLDVTMPEPLPKDSRLWKLPQVLLTPHISGGGHLEATTRKIRALILENLQRYAEGKPLRNRIDPATGYTAKN